MRIAASHDILLLNQAQVSTIARVLVSQLFTNPDPVIIFALVPVPVYVPVFVFVPVPDSVSIHVPVPV